MSSTTEAEVPMETRSHDGSYESAREICKWFGPEAGYEYQAMTDAWHVVIETEVNGEVHFDWYGKDSEISRPAGKQFQLPDVAIEDLNRLTMKQAMEVTDGD